MKQLPPFEQLVKEVKADLIKDWPYIPVLEYDSDKASDARFINDMGDKFGLNNRFNQS